MKILLPPFPAEVICGTVNQRDGDDSAFQDKFSWKIKQDDRNQQGQQSLTGKHQHKDSSHGQQDAESIFQDQEQISQFGAGKKTFQWPMMRTVKIISRQTGQNEWNKQDRSQQEQERNQGESPCPERIFF